MNIRCVRHAFFGFDEALRSAKCSKMLNPSEPRALCERYETIRGLNIRVRV